MSYVVNPDGTYKEVTNLGWLLRHWDEVSSFKIEGGATRVIYLSSNGNSRIIDSSGRRSFAATWEIPEGPYTSMDSVMIVNLKDGRKYVTRWASYEVMLNWLRRPKFIGLPISWFGLKTTIS